MICASWFLPRRSGGLVGGPMRKEEPDHLFVYGDQILADDLQWGLIGAGRSEHGVLHLANSLLYLHLHLPVAIGMFLGVRVLLLQCFEGLANVVAVFLHGKADRCVVALFPCATGILKFGVAQLDQQFGLLDGIALVIELGLQLHSAFLRGGWRGHQENRSHAAKSLPDHPEYFHWLLFAFQHASQNLTSLLSLPNLISILVLIELKELLVGLQGRLRLVQTIVTECADEPTPCPGRFKLINLVEDRERGSIILRKIIGGAEILPVFDILGVELYRGLELLLRIRKIAVLQKRTSQTAAKLRVVRRKSNGLMQGRNRVGRFLLRDLNVRAKLQRLDRDFATVGAIQFGQCCVGLLRIEQ